jgi:hypothetical protein
MKPLLAVLFQSAITVVLKLESKIPWGPLVIPFFLKMPHGCTDVTLELTWKLERIISLDGRCWMTPKEEPRRSSKRGQARLVPTHEIVAEGGGDCI